MPAGFEITNVYRRSLSHDPLYSSTYAPGINIPDYSERSRERKEISIERNDRKATADRATRKSTFRFPSCSPDIIYLYLIYQ